MKKILQSVRDVLAALLILFSSEIVAMMIASLTGVSADTSVISDVFYILVNTAVYVSLVFFMITLYTRRILRADKKEIFRNFEFKRSIKWIVITVSAQGIIILLSYIFCEGRWVFLPHARVNYNLFRAFFDFGIGAGIVEELIFREFLFKNFENKFGKISAVFVVSTIFAVLHITNQQDYAGALLIAVYSFVLSVYLCLLYIRTNSVWNCAIAHGVWNFIFMGCVSVGKASGSQALVNYETTTNTYLFISIGVVLLICIWLIRGGIFFYKQKLYAEYATMKNLESWMQLIDLVRWDFPGLGTQEELDGYKKTVEKNINRKSAICVLDGNVVVGLLLFSTKYNMLCHMSVHPNYRRQKLATKMIELMLENVDRSRDIVVTTFREDDTRGIAPRALYKSLGFEEGELCIDMSYPLQKFILTLQLKQVINCEKDC